VLIKNVLINRSYRKFPKIFLEKAYYLKLCFFSCHTGTRIVTSEFASIGYHSNKRWYRISNSTTWYLQ